MVRQPGRELTADGEVTSDSRPSRSHGDGVLGLEGEREELEGGAEGEMNE